MNVRRCSALLAGALVLAACSSGGGASPTPAAQDAGPDEAAASKAELKAERDKITARLRGASDVRTIVRDLASWPRSMFGEGRNPIPRASEYMLLSAEDKLAARTSFRMVPAPLPDGVRDETPGEAISRPESDLGSPGTPAFNDNHIVWMTDTEPDLGVELWKLYAQDRDTGETTMLAEAAALDDGADPPPDPGYTGPVLLGDHVYWAQVGGAFKDLHVDIYGCEVTQCQPRPVARNAAFPYRVDDHTLAYVSGGKFSRRAHRTTPVTMVVRDVVTGATEEHKADDDVTVVHGFAASHNFLVWTRTLPGGGRQRDRAEWLIRDSGERRHVDSRPARGAFGYPEATDAFVVWGEVSGDSPEKVAGYLVRPGDGALYKVGNSSGLYGFEVDGRRLLWREQKPGSGPQDIMYVTGLVPPAP